MSSTPQDSPSQSAKRAGFFAPQLTSRHFSSGLPAGRLAVLVMAILAGLLAVPPVARSLADADPNGEEVAEKDRVTVRVEPAVPQTSYRVRKPYTGTLVAGRRSSLGFERPGKVIELLADEGDRVAAGQTLARLDQRLLRARRRATAAQLDESRAALAELVAGPREETIAAAAAEVRNREAQSEVARRNLARRRQLVNTGAISREEFDESLFSVRAAEASVDAAQKLLDELVAGTREEQVTAQRARVAALEAQLADIDHELEDTELEAPYGGTIARRRLDEGAIVAAGQAAFDLIEDQRLEAWIGIPPSAARSLVIGEQTKLRIDGGEHDATVVSLRPELDPATRTRNLVLRINQKKPSESTPSPLVAGQVARLTLDETIRRAGFWVPVASLVSGERGLWNAMVVDPDDAASGVVRNRPVELLHTEGGRAYVRGSLRAGDRVITAGAHRVVAGQRVAIERRP